MAGDSPTRLMAGIIFSTAVDISVEILQGKMKTGDKTNPWNQILAEIKSRVEENAFETWFEPTSYIGEEADILYIKVPNSYFKDWLSFHYSNLINECSQQLFNHPFEIKY
ncbi:MAG: hypothetical protein EWM52_12925, partial [Methanosarcina mazei]